MGRREQRTCWRADVVGILDFWQARQVEIQDLTSLAMLGQKKRSITRGLVALMPGWARPCSWRVMGQRRLSGTKGWGAGRDISQITCLVASGTTKPCCSRRSNKMAKCCLCSTALEDATRMSSR